MVASSSVLKAPLTSRQSGREMPARKTACDWHLEVERGPNWLFVKVNGPDVGVSDCPPLADELESMLEEHFINRLVLEIDTVNIPRSYLAGQLELLGRWVCDHDGVMRLCGLSASWIRTLRRCGLGDQFWIYRDRREAVLGDYRPGQPR